MPEPAFTSVSGSIQDGGVAVPEAEQFFHFFNHGWTLMNTDLLLPIGTIICESFRSLRKTPSVRTGTGSRE
jgi:hypothetical protein